MTSSIKFAALLAIASVLYADGPFWQDKPPEKWSDYELSALLTESPWAQIVSPPAGADAPSVSVFLATAHPIELAEQERERRAKNKLLQSCPPGVDVKTHPACSQLADDAPGAAMAAEYRDWVADNRATQIVLSIGVPNSPAFSEEQEIRRMEEESVMHVGRKKFKITGHFPPTERDPYLRLAFPREAKPTDKTMTFDLYIPGVSIGFRTVEFAIKDMLVNGKLEM